VRSLIATTTQTLSLGVGGSGTPEAPTVRQPWVGNDALAGAAANAVPASDPSITFSIWVGSAQTSLASLKAVLQVTVYPRGAPTAPYTMTEDVTGTLLLTGGTLVYDLSQFATAKVGLQITNRSSAGIKVRVQTELHGGVVVPDKDRLDVQNVRVVS